jgi:hypothetical protein
MLSNRVFLFDAHLTILIEDFFKIFSKLIFLIRPKFFGPFETVNFGFHEKKI